MIKYCLACGCKMNSKTNGWECPNCNCYQDANGNFHSSVFENKSSNMTNADKIRSMTDEELSKFLSHYLDCETCELSYIEDIWNETCCKGKHNECWKNLIEWLKQPVEGE